MDRSRQVSVILYVVGAESHCSVKFTVPFSDMSVLFSGVGSVAQLGIGVERYLIAPVKRLRPIERGFSIHPSLTDIRDDSTI